MRKTKDVLSLAFLCLLHIVLWQLNPFLYSQEKEGGDKENIAESLNVSILEIHKPKFEKTPSSPIAMNDSDLTVKYYDPSDEWMVVTFEYTLDDWRAEGEGKPTREERKLTRLVPEITFKIFIEGTSRVSGKNEIKDPTSVLLTGDVTYLNVKKTDNSSRSRYGVFFLTPETVELYDLKSLYSVAKGNIRVEAYFGDKKALKGKDSEEVYKDLREKDEEWDKVFKNLEKVANNVITKDQSPWALASLDRFPAIKPKSSSSDKK